MAPRPAIVRSSSTRGSAIVFSSWPATTRRRVFAGYAGWGIGQLEAELADEDWILEPALPDDAFTDDPDELWRDVLRRKGGIYELVARMPEDPRVN